MARLDRNIRKDKRYKQMGISGSPFGFYGRIKGNNARDTRVGVERVKTQLKNEGYYVRTIKKSSREVLIYRKR